MKQTIKMTESELRQVVSEIIQEGIEEGKFGRAMAGLGLAATLATAPACSHFNHYEPQWEHVGPYSEQEKQEKTWNTHAERGDWNEIEPGVGFIYDCYTRCANSGGGWTIHVIFADKSTGKFILPQECQQYLYGRYMPNCNCFENENTTDRVNTNGLQRINGNENVTVFESKQHMYDEGYWKHNKNMKQDKLVEAIKNSIKQVLNEGPGAGYDVSFKGLNISQLRSFKVGEKNGQRIIEFKAILAPGIVEWSASGYYDSVTSKGIYYDNELVDEFDEQQKTVNGGELSGYVYESEVSDYIANGGQVTTKDVSDYIRWHLQDFSFKTMVGGGYVHTDLSDPMVFENVEVTPENSYYGSEGVYLNYIEIRAKDISDTINWFFANCYNFDEIYGQNEEDYADEQPVNEDAEYAAMSDIDKIQYDLQDKGVKVVKEQSDGDMVTLAIPTTIDGYELSEIAKTMRLHHGYATQSVKDTPEYKIVTMVKKDRDDSQIDSDFDEMYTGNPYMNESLKKVIKESITKVLNEWGFPDNMDYNVETKDTPVDEIQKYTNDDVKSSYDPSDIAIAFRNMAISNDDAEFVAAIGEALLSEDGLTDNDERRKILGIQQDYQQARLKVNVLLKMVRNGTIKGSFERYKNDIPNRS